MKISENLTYKDALEQYDSLDKFLKNKIKFLESKEILNENSKNVAWTKLRNDVYMFEVMWNKDLALFNEDDVRMVLSSVVAGTLNSAKTLKSVINQYEIWALKTGLNPASNPCDTIDVKKIAIPVRTMIDVSVISINELFELWDYIQTYPNEYCDRVTYQNFAMILLMRVGLKGKKQWNELMYLKEEDIDFENGLINVTNRDKDVVDGKKQLEVVKTLTVDERILEVIKKAIEEKGYEYEFSIGRGNQGSIRKENEYIDYGYIIKPEQEQGEFINSTVFRKRIENFFKAGERTYISARDMFRNAKLDMILDIKKVKGKLEIKDFKDVQDFYEPYQTSETAYLNLKEFYESYTGDIVIGNVRGKSEEQKRKEKKEFLRKYYFEVTKEKRRKARNKAKGNK